MNGSTKKQSAAARELCTDDFINHERVKKCEARLNAFTTDHPLIVSDTLDAYGNQYVNLVQKGGGVLGVALVGYTYILEMMGIRFMRLAGTSAGAINTALMTVIGSKEDAKSIKVLDCICKLNFFNLVDGHPVAKWIIKNFITHSDFTRKMKRWILGIVATLAILLFADFFLLGLQKHYNVTYLTRFAFVCTGFVLLAIGIIATYIRILLKRLKISGFGINPGDYFYDWIKERLVENGVVTVQDLNDKASADIEGLHLREEHPDELNNLKGDVTFITSELVTENKIQFPEMCKLFRLDPNELQPAGFVRASMSIPVFFESYFINDIPCTHPDIQKRWMDTFGEADPPHTARFVDGGILSNFPINLFYKPNITTPRLPAFGIDLDDSKPEDKTKHAASWSLGGYFGRMFNTIRFYYDKDFLLKNRMFEKGIGKINLQQFNWLNFFLKNDEKIEMFLLGAEAATDFLINFKWDDYKNNRVEIHQQLIKKQASGAATTTSTSNSIQ